MGTSTRSQTVRTNPWSPAARAVTPAIGALQGMNFSDGGNFIAPNSDLQKGIAQSTYDYAMNDPLQSASNNYFGNILSGGTNPYLTSMFNQAAGDVRSKLDSQFEAAGRYGSGDHAREIGQAYNDLATNLYGNQYNADQNRMLTAAQVAPGAAYQGFDRQMAAAGGLENFDYNQSMDRIRQYLGMTQPLLSAGGSTTTPLYQNNTATALGALGTVGGILAAPMTGGTSLLGTLMGHGAAAPLATSAGGMSANMMFGGVA